MENKESLDKSKILRLIARIEESLDLPKILGSIVGTLAVIPILFVTWFVNGWITSTFWDWFVIPLFGARVLSVPQAIGLSMLVGFVTHQVQPENKESTATKLVKMILYPGITLISGYVVHRWFM